MPVKANWFVPTVIGTFVSAQIGSWFVSQVWEKDPITHILELLHNIEKPSDAGPGTHHVTMPSPPDRQNFARLESKVDALQTQVADLQSSLSTVEALLRRLLTRHSSL
eukprot:m.58365 g.58365  ORF g.58365 m.58365 type:complete len:108 (-) comp7138_c0_seq1:97-420(-)